MASSPADGFEACRGDPEAIQKSPRMTAKHGLSKEDAFAESALFLELGEGGFSCSLGSKRMMDAQSKEEDDADGPKAQPGSEEREMGSTYGKTTPPSRSTAPSTSP